MLASQNTFAQGFKKLDVQSKYGDTQANDPIVPKSDPTTTKEEDQKIELGDSLISLKGVDVELKQMIQEMANLTGRQFIISDKVIGSKKITIISDKPMNKETAYQAFLSALEINGLTTVMTPAGLINIVQQKDSLKKPLDVFKGPDPLGRTRTDKFITRIIQLENISASEISKVVKDLVSKNGNMFAYPATNSMIITDTGSNIEHIMRLVRELDKEGPQEELVMIPVIYADADDIAGKISEIFDSGSTKKSSVRSRRRSKKTELADVQLITKIISDERTNSVLIMGTKRGILKVRTLIAQLDRPVLGADGKIHVYYLKYAKAKDVAEVLSNLVSSTSKSSSKTKSKSKSAKASSSSSVTLEGGVQATADEDTNSLIVVASPKDYKTLVEQVIMKLDIVRPQVYLESVIMSLDVQKSTTLGVSGLAGLLNTLGGGNSLTAFGGIMPTTPNAISTIASSSGGFGGGIFSSDTVDFTLSDGSTASIPAISSIIMALASDTNANVLSTPSILTLDNEEAEIQVGQEVPVPSGTTVSSGVTTFDVTREDTGIILKITPQISENDSVRLNIEQEITSVFTTDDNLGPTLDKKSVQTVVIANNRQTIVIGGLIDDQATVTTQKVPLLGDVPVLGALFRTRVTAKSKTNLLVFITPYIIRERKDYLAILKKKIEERNNFIDTNYGRGQRKLIRKSINDHAQELLEFKCTLPGDSNPCYGSNTINYPTSSTTQAVQNTQTTQPVQTAVTEEVKEEKSYAKPIKKKYKN